MAVITANETNIIVIKIPKTLSFADSRTCDALLRTFITTAHIKYQTSNNNP